MKNAASVARSWAAGSCCRVIATNGPPTAAAVPEIAGQRARRAAGCAAAPRTPARTPTPRPPRAPARPTSRAISRGLATATTHTPTGVSGEPAGQRRRAGWPSRRPASAGSSCNSGITNPQTSIEPGISSGAAQTTNGAATTTIPKPTLPCTTRADEHGGPEQQHEAEGGFGHRVNVATTVAGSRDTRTRWRDLARPAATSVTRMDLADPEVRAGLTERLMARYADRPVVLGPGILAARTEFVDWVREVGGTVLVLATAARGRPQAGRGRLRGRRGRAAADLQRHRGDARARPPRAAPARPRRRRRSRPSTPSGGPSGWAVRS